MAVEYRITFDDQHAFNYKIELEREPLSASGLIPLSDWTNLENHKCTNCPLDPAKHKTCPAAADLQTVVEDFNGLPAFKKAWVHVRTNQREYSKLVNLEEAIRSLLGVIMATSACPILAKLKPMAHSHLPFANNNEFTLRTVSMYVMREFFRMHEGGTPDWQLADLTNDFKDLQLVNQALWHRIHDVCAGDTNLKVLLSFFSMSSSMTYSLETQLQKIRSMVVNEDNLVSM